MCSDFVKTIVGTDGSSVKQMVKLRCMDPDTLFYRQSSSMMIQHFPITTVMYGAATRIESALPSEGRPPGFNFLSVLILAQRDPMDLIFLFVK